MFEKTTDALFHLPSFGVLWVALLAVETRRTLVVAR